MRLSNTIAALGTWMAIVGVGVNGIAEHAYAGEKLKWKQIIGILAPGTSVGGLLGAPGPWTVRNGSASVDLDDGEIKFEVMGLVLAVSPPIAVLGTTGVVTKVKGTLVCNGTGSASSEFVDTEDVPLDAQGDAKFIGRVTLPFSCVNSTQLAFLIRIAESGLPAILNGKWNAFGSNRIP